MKKVINKYLVVIGLVFLMAAGAGVRFFHLATNPVMLNRDEAALAYNAFLLKEAGVDEWQQPWPLALQSFGDYKLPGYIWLTILSFAAFGYSDWAVRVPAAVAGTLLILVTYWLTRRLNWEKHWSILAAALIAFLPVFVFYSRMAWEANVSLLLTVLSLGLIWFQPDKRLHSHREDLVGTGILLWSVFTYNTPFLLLPFLIVILPLRRGWKQLDRWLWVVMGLLIVFALAAVVQLPISTQKSGITLFSDQNVWLASVEYRQQFTGVAQTVLGNKYVFLAQLLAQKWWGSFSPHFMVIKGGDHPWHQLPGYAHFFWDSYLLSLIGVVTLFVMTIKKSLATFSQTFTLSQVQLSQDGLSLYLLLISLLPAIITVDAPHATRSLLFFFLLIINGVAGARHLIKVLASPAREGQLSLAIIVVFILSTTVQFTQYFAHYLQEYPRQSYFNFQGGYPELITKLDQDYPHKEIAIVDGPGFQYVVTAWYLKTSPQEFFDTIIRQQPDKLGFRYGQQLQQFHFIADDDDRSDKEGIVVEWNRDNSEWIVKEY